MKLPPLIREVQQSWWFHLGTATIVAIGSAAFICFGQKNEFSAECIKIAVIAGGIYLFASLQHSPGSASFNRDGTPNEPVQKVIEAQKEGVEVEVIPK